MKLTKENYKQYVPEKDWMLCGALLRDVKELNDYLDDTNQSNRTIYIDFETEHTEYSPERVDPCPDYYGMYRLFFEKQGVSFGVEMDIDYLDGIICTLYEYITGNIGIPLMEL